jgi:hypothetical protein
MGNRLRCTATRPSPSIRISCQSDAGVVVGAGLHLVAARVPGRSMAGSSGVSRGSITVMSLAGRSLPAAPVCNAARQVPAVSSRRFLFAGNRVCQRTGGGIVAGPRGLVLPAGPRACPGHLWRRCERCPCRSDLQRWEVSGTCPVRPGSTDVGCGRPAAQRRARPVRADNLVHVMRPGDIR